MESRWSGRSGGNPLELWIGMEFDRPIHAQCVSFLDLATNGVKSVEVQVLTSDTSDWVSLVRAEDLVPGVRHNIPCVPITPISTPIKSLARNSYSESLRIWATSDMTGR